MEALNLSNKNLSSSHELGAFPKAVSFIDLSNNSISDAAFLQRLTNLAILNLDYNLFESFSSFPVLERLDTLSINSNNLVELPDSSKFPKLQNLSLMKNPCCPFLRHSSTENEVKTYRLRVISNFPTLSCLDGSFVTQSERKKALQTKNTQNQRFRCKVAIKKPEKPKNYLSEGNRFITNEHL